MAKQIGAEQLAAHGSHRSTRSLDVGILLRIAGLDKFKLNAPPLRPCLDRATEVFRPVVASNRGRCAAPLAHLI